MIRFNLNHRDPSFGYVTKGQFDSYDDACGYAFNVMGYDTYEFEVEPVEVESHNIVPVEEQLQAMCDLLKWTDGENIPVSEFTEALNSYDKETGEFKCLLEDELADIDPR